MKTVNEVFNFRRFGAYAMRSWSLYAKKYLVHAGIFAGIMVLFIALVRAFEGHPIDSADLNSVTPFYIVFILAFFATFPMVVMKPFKSRHTITMENTVPASTTEKWLFVVLNTTIVAAILCAVSILLTVLTGMAVAGSEPFAEYFRVMMHETPGEVYLVYAFVLLGLQAVVMLAGTQERRNHRVSILLVGATIFVAMMVLLIFPIWLSEEFDTTMQFGPMFTFSRGYVESQLSSVSYFGDLSIDDQTGKWQLIGSGTAVVLLFWLASWFNFRERSIK